MTNKHIPSTPQGPHAYASDRAAGQIYHGSVVEARGATVSYVYDCECPPCIVLDDLDPCRRATVVLRDGRLLEHARFTSFSEPEALAPGTLDRLQREADAELRAQARTASMQEWREWHGPQRV